MSEDLYRFRVALKEAKRLKYNRSVSRTRQLIYVIILLIITWITYPFLLLWLNIVAMIVSLLCILLIIEEQRNALNDTSALNGLIHGLESDIALKNVYFEPIEQGVITEEILALKKISIFNF